MTVTYDTAGAGITTLEDTLQTWSHTRGVGDDPYAVVAISRYTFSGAINHDTTYAGVAMEKLGTPVIDAGNVHAAVRGLVGVPAGASTVGIANPDSYLAAQSFTFHGVHQTAPIGVVASNSGTSSTPSVTVSAEAGDLVIGILTFDDSRRTANVGSGQTFVAEYRANSSLYPLIAVSSKPGASSVTMGYSVSASDQWVMYGFALKPATPYVPPSIDYPRYKLGGTVVQAIGHKAKVGGVLVDVTVQGG